jgi:hypothetical protein
MNLKVDWVKIVRARHQSRIRQIPQFNVQFSSDFCRIPLKKKSKTPRIPLSRRRWRLRPCRRATKTWPFRGLLPAVFKLANAADASRVMWTGMAVGAATVGAATILILAAENGMECAPRAVA